jgi:hypothetical protein
MSRFKKSTLSLFATVATCILLSSCQKEDPIISAQVNPGFFIDWIFLEEQAVCTQGSVYNGSNQGNKIELRIRHNFTYQYLIDDELIQSGTVTLRTEEVAFSPSFYPNSIEMNSKYIFAGTRLKITTKERFDPSSTETCDVSRTYGKKR